MKKVVIESKYLYNYEHPEDGITVGGTQRYSLDIGRMFFDMGYKVFFITKSNSDFQVDYNDWATIISLNVPQGNVGDIEFSTKVYRYCKKLDADIACYSDLEIGWPKCYENSFAIQHGIHWDNPYMIKNKFVPKYIYPKAITKFKKIICVDTNFINWCRERNKNYFNSTEKFVYIPNYADTDIFVYKYREITDTELTLFYPKRLAKARGFNIFMDMCKVLIDKGYSIKPVLAIEDFKRDTFFKMYPYYKDIKIETVHPLFNEMPQYYYEAFLTFIPTIWSEGTSLAAIESICCGCPVIASDVGGLANIIIPEFNGIIISPKLESFVKATEAIINNRKLRDNMAKNCRYMNQILGKNRWERQIKNALNFLL